MLVDFDGCKRTTPSIIKYDAYSFSFKLNFLKYD
jgi:hypothetical protein